MTTFVLSNQNIMKKSELTLLKEKYQELQYLYGLFFESPSINLALTTECLEGKISIDADSIIRDHYDNQEITESHWSGNPEWETSRSVSGEVYIQHTFNGDYEEAFKHA